MHTQNDARSFLQKLLQNPPRLPFEPLLLPTLFALTEEDSSASIGDLAKLIERSQTLTARVLSMSNSASYGQEFKVSNLQRAISLLGVREIRMLAIMTGVASIMKEARLPESFDITAQWEHQLRTAAAARALAAELGGPSGLCGPGAREEDRLSQEPDEAYITGLLHDIGKVLFAAGRPELWMTMEERRQKEAIRFCEAENEYWGMDHALIGAAMLHHWQLPQLLTEPINWHHAPWLSTTYKMEARLLAAANAIAHSFPDMNGALCEEAVAFLPAGIDAPNLAAAITQGVTDIESFLAFLR